MDDDVAALLESCVVPTRGGQPSVVMLCTAADRLVPAFSARYNMAAAFLVQHRSRECLDAARQALAIASEPLQVALAYNLIAGAFVWADDWSRVRAASVRAMRVYPALLGPHLELAWAAVRLRDERTAIAAMRELEILTHGRMDLLDEQQRRLEGLAAVLRASLDDGAVTTLRRVVDASSTVSAPLLQCVLEADPHQASPISAGGVVGSGDPRGSRSGRLRLVPA